MAGQGPAFVRRCILWPIVRRPQPFRDFKGSFAQFLLSATLSAEKQESSGGGEASGFSMQKEKRWETKGENRKRDKRGGDKTEFVFDVLFNYMEWQYSKSGPQAQYICFPTPSFGVRVTPHLYESLEVFPWATGRHAFLMAPRHMP